MRNKKIINAGFVILELFSAIIIFYSYRLFLKKHTDIFPDELFTSIILGIGILAILNISVVYLLVFLNSKTIKEKFNYMNSVLFGFYGILISLGIILFINIILNLNHNNLTEFLLIFISYVNPILFLNYGLRKKTVPNNVYN